MKYLSLFSGIGGFEIGITKAVPDAECIGFSEIDPYASAIYQYHFPETITKRTKGGSIEFKRGHINLGDCTKIEPRDIPDFDLLVGGFPCQAFSIAKD